MPISQNTALFSLLGTTYGGDGKSTFALPDMQGNAPIQPGQGQGLSSYVLGEMSGTESVTLLVSEMPVHTHALNATSQLAQLNAPGSDRVLARSVGGFSYSTSFANNQVVNMAFQGLPPAGGGLPHNNMMPYLTLNYCIALQGIFPQRP